MTYKLSCYPYKISLHGSGDILNAADCYRRLAGAQTMSLLVWFALVTPHVREVSTGITTIIPVSIFIHISCGRNPRLRKPLSLGLSDWLTIFYIYDMNDGMPWLSRIQHSMSGRNAMVVLSG